MGSSVLSEEEKSAIQKAREQYGDDIKAKRIKGQLFIVRRPGFEYQRAVNKLGKRDADVYDIQLNLVQSNLVYPDRPIASEFLTQYKGTVQVLAEAIGDLASPKDEDVDLGEE